jgi:hypothetical protein
VIGSVCTEAGKEISNLMFPAAAPGLSWAIVVAGPTHKSHFAAAATARIGGSDKVCLFMGRTILAPSPGQ